MLIFKIDNYEVHKHDVKTNSNYNVGISVYENNEMQFGWHEKESTKDVDILEAVISGIKRHEKRKQATTLEEFLNI